MRRRGELMTVEAVVGESALDKYIEASVGESALGGNYRKLEEQFERSSDHRCVLPRTCTPLPHFHL